MLEALHEWLDRFGFIALACAVALAIAYRIHRVRRMGPGRSSFMRELRKRYPHAERARMFEEFEIECRPSDAHSWGWLRARAETRGLELRLRTPTGFGWPGVGWRALVPWQDLQIERDRRQRRRVLSLSVTECPGALWVVETSALELARHARAWWPAPALRVELERGVERVWRGPTVALLTVIAAFSAWFLVASAGVMTEWPRERAFANNHVERVGEVTEIPKKGNGKLRIAYSSGDYTGAFIAPPCAIRTPRIGQRVTVYVSVPDPARASVGRPRDPFKTRIPVLILLGLVLPSLVAVTGYRFGAVIRHTQVPDPLPAAEGAEVARGSSRWHVSFGEAAVAAPALLAIGALIAVMLIQAPPPCPRDEVRLQPPIAQAEPFPR